MGRVMAVPFIIHVVKCVPSVVALGADFVDVNALVVKGVLVWAVVKVFLDAINASQDGELPATTISQSSPFARFHWISFSMNSYRPMTSR
jgi:hypothetical protein